MLGGIKLEIDPKEKMSDAITELVDFSRTKEVEFIEKVQEYFDEHRTLVNDFVYVDNKVSVNLDNAEKLMEEMVRFEWGKAILNEVVGRTRNVREQNDGSIKLQAEHEEGLKKLFLKEGE